MSDPIDTASAALVEATEIARGVGLVDALADLAREVGRGNADRYEPDDLGDTHLSLAMQSVENFRTRALRRYRGDDREPADRLWSIDELELDSDHGAPVFKVRGPGGFPMRIIVVKTPLAEGRSPNFNSMPEWQKVDSKVRTACARRNSLVLGGFKTTMQGQLDLLGCDATPHVISDYMLLWASNERTGLTAGWLGVPILGVYPFAAVERLWFDEELTPTGGRRLPDVNADMPSYDARPAPDLGVRIKSRSGEREG